MRCTFIGIRPKFIEQYLLAIATATNETPIVILTNATTTTPNVIHNERCILWRYPNVHDLPPNAAVSNHLYPWHSRHNDQLLLIVNVDHRRMIVVTLNVVPIHHRLYHTNNNTNMLDEPH